jgi:hypothetical protein
VTNSIARLPTDALTSDEPVLVRPEERLESGVIIPAKWVYPDQCGKKQRRPSSTRGRKAPSRNAAFEQVASACHANGYSPLPVAGKIPRISKWTDQFCHARPTAEELQAWGRAARGKWRFDGVGIACHAGVTFIDIDVDDWAPIHERLQEIIPELHRCPAIIGKRGMKLVLRSVDGMNHREWNVPLRATSSVLEVLAHGRQGVIPPSIHPATGQRYMWRDEAVTPMAMPVADLPIITAEHVAAIRAAFPPAPKKAEVKERLKTKSVAEKQEARKAERELNRWDGHPDAMRRCVVALEHLDADPYDNWSIAADAFCSWAGAEGRPPWDTWSRKSAKFDQASQDAQWSKSMERAAEGTGSGMGAIIAMAVKLGFDKSLKAWPTLYAARHGKRVQHGDSKFELAAAAMPKGPKFREALHAQRRLAWMSGALTPRDLRLLDWLHAFANEGAGFAWPSERRLAELLNVNDRAVSHSLRNLVRAGAVVIGPFQSNPDRLPTWSYAFVSPVGKTWDDMLQWQAECTAHDADSV